MNSTLEFFGNVTPLDSMIEIIGKTWLIIKRFRHLL